LFFENKVVKCLISYSGDNWQNAMVELCQCCGEVRTKRHEFNLGVLGSFKSTLWWKKSLLHFLYFPFSERKKKNTRIFEYDSLVIHEW